MSRYRIARLTRPSLARLGAVLLALSVLLPGQPLQAAVVPMRARPAPPRTSLSKPANSNPVAHDDTFVAFAGQEAQTLFPLDNDTDIDLDPLTIYSTTPDVHADLYRPFDNLEIEYTPNPG